MRDVFGVTFFSLVVAREGERYLLVEEREKDGNRAWYLPAGGVKSGETILSAAIRETREEAGVVVEILGLLGGDQVLATDGVTTKIRMVFLARAIGGKLKSQADDESLRAAWFHPREIAELRLRHAEVKDWIQIAERLPDSPLPRFTDLSPAILRQRAKKEAFRMGGKTQDES